MNMRTIKFRGKNLYNNEWILTNKGISIIGKKKIESDIPFKNIKEDNGNIYLVSANNQLVIYLPQTQQLQFHEISEVLKDSL